MDCILCSKHILVRAMEDIAKSWHGQSCVVTSSKRPQRELAANPTHLVAQLFGELG
jgi:hypothetical protein